MLPVIVRKRNSSSYMDPFSQLDQALSRWANSWFDQSEQPTASVCPVDIREDDEHFYIDAELPGFAKDEIKVSVNDDVLTIDAEHKAEDKKETETHGVKTLVSQRKQSSVSRSFSLPENVDVSNIEAKNVDGILQLTLGKVPPAEDPKPVEIEVK